MGPAVSNTFKGHKLEIDPTPTIVAMNISFSYLPSFSHCPLTCLPPPSPSKGGNILKFPNVEEKRLGPLPYGTSLASGQRPYHLRSHQSRTGEDETPQHSPWVLYWPKEKRHLAGISGDSCAQCHTLWATCASWLLRDAETLSYLWIRLRHGANLRFILHQCPTDMLDSDLASLRWPLREILNLSPK